MDVDPHVGRLVHAGAVDHTPHGTLTATLPNTQGGTGTVTLTMEL